MPEFGEFTLESEDPKYIFTAELGNDAPMPTDDSYGGWSVTPIPKRMGLTEWEGRPPLGIAIDFIIDRINEPTSESPGVEVERMRDRLEKMAATHSRDDEPPTIILRSGGHIPHDYAHAPWIKWVIESLAWNREEVIVNAYRNQIRVSGSLVLRQYNVDEALEAYRGPAAKNRAKNKNKGKDKNKGGSGQRYIVKAGDTLTKIASDKLGDAKRWREIADLNNIRDPRSIKPGQRLRLPKK